MSNILLIFIYLFLGFLAQKINKFPRNSYKTLNKIVISICLPALALYFIPKINWNLELLFPIAAAWIGFILAFILFASLGSYLKWSKKLIGCLILTAGLSNASFLGFPIIEALYGKEGMKTAILFDQPGCFVVISTLGVLVSIYYSNGTANIRTIIKKIILFPPFISFIIGVVMNILNNDFNTEIQFGLHKIGSLVTPLALFSVGLQLNFDKRSKHFKFLALGLTYKLVLMPLIFLIIYVFILKQDNLAIQVTITEAAMAPMITASILASNYGLKPKLSSMMVGFGIPISFITLTIWHFILQHI